jgi:hypothetical protein
VVDRFDDGRRVSAVVARRRLHQKLVEARRRAGFASREQAAAALGWSLRKQSLLETGEAVLQAKDLDTVLGGLAIPEDQAPAWRALVAHARERGWWDAFDDADLSDAGKRFVAYEWGARRLRSYDGSIMPPLLQIPGYTRAALSSGLVDRPPEQINRLLTVRRQRQRVLAPPDALDYHVILDEAALRRPGGDADTMAAQLFHVVDLASTRSNITVQVVPFGAGLYAGQAGTFVLMEFDGPDDDPGLAHLEPGFDGSLYVEERRDLYLYSRLFQSLADVALSPADSLDCLRMAAGAYA